MEFEYTPELIQELVKCGCDPIYFMKQYVFDEGTGSPELWEQFTVWAVEAANYRTMEIGEERASGRTRFLAAYALWYATFHESRTVLMGSHNIHATRSTRELVYDMYDKLPKWLKPVVTRYGNQGIEFQNEACIKFQTISDNMGRGFAISLLLLDNWELVDKFTQVRVFGGIVPCISTGGQCISTGDATPWQQISQ